MLFSKCIKRATAISLLTIMIAPPFMAYDIESKEISEKQSWSLAIGETTLLVENLRNTVKLNSQHTVAEEEIVSIFTVEIKEEHKKKKAKVKKKKKEAVVKTASNGKPYKYYEVYDAYYGSKDWHSLNNSIQEYTYDLCIEYGIEKYYKLILCQLFFESQYKSNIISKTQDYGIAQINKCNHNWLRKELNITDFLDPYQSILCNIYLMSSYLEKYSVENSLFCYNTGKHNGSNNYSRKILSLWYNYVREIKE